MTLIKSISGIRGTIGGLEGEGLTPNDIVKFSVGYALWLKETGVSRPKVVVGRDARISGKLVSGLVKSTLMAMGVDILDLDLSTTPTVEVAVSNENADGGIILTASHNPKEWNALKLLNSKGEFVSKKDGERILELSETKNVHFSNIDEIGKEEIKQGYIDEHINMIAKHPRVNLEAIKKSGFKVAADVVNSSGGIAIPKLLKKLGVNEFKIINEIPDGNFAHNPEPLPQNLTELSRFIKSNKYDLGIAVDPDVDRLALICEDGSMFGEEYTLVAIADYILETNKGPTVSNLSSTRALRDVTENRGEQYFSSAVGEVNVVEKMKEVNAVIGGEGNGGIIVPDFHYGRDALIGIALFLSYLAEKEMKMTELRRSFPDYHISKNKIKLNHDFDPDIVLEKIKVAYENMPISTIDGVKIELNDKEWVHLRKSNTEPIIRIYCESTSQDKSVELGERFIDEMKALM